MEMNMIHIQLASLLQADSSFTIRYQPLLVLQMKDDLIRSNPGKAYYEDLYNLANTQLHVERNSWLPDINLTYSTGTNQHENAKNYLGYQVGLSIPVFFGAQAAKTKAARIGTIIAQSEIEHYTVMINARIEELKNEAQKYKEAILYYDEIGKVLSDEIFKTASQSYENGEIDYFEYIQSLESAVQIEMDYMNNLDLYNQTILEINYITL